MNHRLKQLITVGCLLMPALLIAMFPQLATFLQYDRIAITHGAWWQLFTQHFCHWSADHLFYDVIALVVLCIWASQYRMKQLWFVVLTSSLSISVGLYIFQPNLLYARGLSGIDCALMGMVMVHVYDRAKKEHDTTWLILVVISLLGFLAKTVYELMIKRTLFMDSQLAGIIALPLAHLIGCITGILIARFTMHKQPVLHRQDLARFHRAFSSSHH